jgi:hypothetical protein
MFGKHFLVKALVGLLVIALLVGGVSASQRDAWTQGYMVGRLSAGSDGGALTPLMPYGYGGYAGPQFGGFGVILGLGLLVLVLVGVGGAVMHRTWAMHGGPQGRDEQTWQRMAQAHAERVAHHWRHGPPWCWDRDDKPQTEPGKSEAAAPSTAGEK